MQNHDRLLSLYDCAYNKSTNSFDVCRTRYRDLGDEAIVVNVLAVTLLALMVVMPVVLLSDKFRSRNVQVVAVHGI